MGRMEEEGLNIHLLLLFWSQLEVTANTSPGGDFPAPGMRTIPGRNPLQEADCHPAEAISCDKVRFQEAAGELGTLQGGDWVHSYRGVPAPHSEANSSPDWDNACLTYWTSHLALNSRTNKTLVSVRATLLLHTVIKRFTCMKHQLKMIQVCNEIYMTLLTKVKALFLAHYYWRIQKIAFKHCHFCEH